VALLPKDDATTQEGTPTPWARSSIALLLRSRTPRSTIAPWQKSSIFGIAWTALTVNEAKGGNVASLTASHPQFSILTSAPVSPKPCSPARLVSGLVDGSRFRVRL
jgi:hypothetical protein